MFQRKNALVVGVGRYTGIGAAICRQLAAQGMNIIFSSCLEYDKLFIDQIKYDQLIEECKQYGVLCEWLDCDVRKSESISNIFNFAEETLGATIDTFIY